jgi:hypothetical protein
VTDPAGLFASDRLQRPDRRRCEVRRHWIKKEHLQQQRDEHEKPDGQGKDGNSVHAPTLPQQVNFCAGSAVVLLGRLEATALEKSLYDVSILCRCC